MKITDLQIYRLELPTDEWMILEIETDEGLTGYGEVTGSCDDNGLAALLSGLRERLIGQSPLAIAECKRFFTQWTYPVLSTIRTNATALSGLDQALWDLTAKHYRMPLYKLYGGAGKPIISLYANLNKAIRAKRSPEALEQNGLNAIKEGFTLLKCTPFDEINPTNTDNDLEPGMERLAALLQHISIDKVAIDCHQRFERFTLARMVGGILERYGLPYWVEDPVDIADYSSMKCLISRYPEVRWAAGEDALTYRMLDATIHSRCYEIIMPDVKYVGGPSVAKTIISYGEGVGLKVTMHNPNGIIATAHSAHLSALCASALPMEFPFGAVPQRELLSSPQEIVRDGCYHLNDEPGIGVAIKPEAMRIYGQRYERGRWIALK